MAVRTGSEGPDSERPGSMSLSGKENDSEEAGRLSYPEGGPENIYHTSNKQCNERS